MLKTNQTLSAKTIEDQQTTFQAVFVFTESELFSLVVFSAVLCHVQCLFSPGFIRTGFLPCEKVIFLSRLDIDRHVLVINSVFGKA